MNELLPCCEAWKFDFLFRRAFEKALGWSYFILDKLFD